MLMNEHDDAYVDAMLMVNMQANTRSVTVIMGMNWMKEWDAIIDTGKRMLSLREP